MMKRYLIYISIASCLLLHPKASAQNREVPLFDIAVEWSYVASFHLASVQNFYAPEGYRIHRSNSELDYFTNAEVMVRPGINLTPRWNLSAGFGVTGVHRKYTAIPITLRATHYFSSKPDKDRFLAYLDCGFGIHTGADSRAIFRGAVGGGYQLYLSRHFRLGFLLSIRSTLFHPEVVLYGESIAPGDINKNDALSTSVSIGMNLTF